MVTELLAAGVDPRTVMGRAGHSSEATTLGIYAKVRPATDSAAAELWGQMLNAKLTELREQRPLRLVQDPADPDDNHGPSAGRDEVAS